VVAASLAAPRARAPWRTWAALGIVYVVWSSTYLAIRVVVASMPPLLSAGARFALAGGALLAWDVWRARTLPHAREWLRALPVGLLLFLGGNGLVAIAERTASSGAAALACALAPVWAGVLSSFGRERPRARQWLGFALGFAGVAVLSAGAMPDRASAALLFLAPIAWASGTLLAKRFGTSASLQLLVGGSSTMVIGLALGESLPPSMPAVAWLAWVYLTIVGSMLAFSAYTYLIKHAPVPVAMSYAYVNPVLAVLLGAALAGEPLGASMLVSGALVTVAVVLIVR